MKVALHALDHLNAIAWQQTGKDTLSQNYSHDDVPVRDPAVIPKPAGMASLERCLTLPDQLDGVTQPLLSASLNQVPACNLMAVVCMSPTPSDAAQLAHTNWHRSTCSSHNKLRIDHSV